MADQNQVKKVEQGVAAWNTWREQHLDVKLDLSFADLSEADLDRAILSRDYLSRADLSFADLSGADLSRATLGGTNLAYLNLRSVQGLIEIYHEGPSIVSLHSIQLPHDGSTLHFLRGTGVPDEWIDFYRSTIQLLQ